MARAHRPLYQPLLEWAEIPLGHRTANELAYRVSGDVVGERVLLLDDTFTTGARVQSAASALALAGADVIAAVALGRIVRPDYSEEAADLWERQTSTRFDFGVCCLEEQG